MTFRVLIVCSANVCRSPMAAALLRQSFEDTTLQDRVEVTSSGEHAWRGSQMCDEIAAEGTLDELESQARERHRPTQLDTERLLGADLVLATDRAIRSSVVRMDPQVHDRVFTLREAAALAKHVLRDTGSAGYDDELDWLEGLVAEMNDSRGLIDMPGFTSYPRTFLPWPRLSVHDHDVPDPHDDTRVPHRVTRDLLLSACADLTAAFQASTRSGSGRTPPWWWSQS